MADPSTTEPDPSSSPAGRSGPRPSYRLDPGELGGDPACWSGLIEDDRDRRRAAELASSTGAAETQTDQTARPNSRCQGHVSRRKREQPAPRSAVGRFGPGSKRSPKPASVRK